MLESDREDRRQKLGVIKERVYVNGKVDYWTWELPPTVIKLSAIEGGKQADGDIRGAAKAGGG